MDLSSYLKNDELRTIVAEALAEDQTKLNENWDSLYSLLKHNRFVLPIMGIQGSGKSSLLSALCYDKTVLPVDANETTSVPVEISYAYNQAEQAVIYFKDGTQEICKPTEETLAQYVHQDFNPGNIKNVKSVSITSLAEYLKNGIVLVDLPGLGSLTDENKKTTVDYLKEATGIIYLLRTNPTLTKNEAIDLKIHWVHCPTMFFVQNKWTDESSDELAESMDFNKTVLEEIAKSINIEINSTFKIIPVDAYTALSGMLSKSQEAVNKSNLPQLQQLLSNFSKEWPKRLSNDIRNSLLTSLYKAKKSLEENISIINLGADEAAAKIEAEKDELDCQLDLLETNFLEFKKYVNNCLRNIGTDVKKWVDEEKPAFRSHMLNLLSKGVTDSNSLTNAMSDCSADSFARLEDKILDTFAKFQHDVNKLYEQSFDEFNMSFDPQGNIKGEDDTKYRNFATPAGTLLFGGAGAALPFLVAVPGGAIVAGAIAVVSGIVGFFLGSKTKESLLDSKIRELEPQVNSRIDAFFSSAEKDVLQSTNDEIRSRLFGIEENIEQQRKKLRSLYREKKKVSRLEGDDRKAALAKQTGGLSIIEKSIRELSA
jgi:predicted GTPase